MNYLMYINQINRRTADCAPIQYLVSGCDSHVRNTVLRNVLQQTQSAGQPLIVVGDGAEHGEQAILREQGYRLENGISGEYYLHNPFRKLGSVKGISRLRQLLAIMDYDERQKGKLSAYLSFIRHLEYLRTGSQTLDLTMEKLAEYCTALAVEETLQALLEEGTISAQQQMLYLAKYAECAAAGADFEDMFFLLMPFTRAEGRRLNGESGTAVLFPTGEQLGSDDALRGMILKLLQYALEDPAMANATVLVFDKGYGSRGTIAELLNGLPPHINLHVFSEDIFTLCDKSALAMILNRFSVRVYSRHLTMTSAQAIESACGDIEVVKKSYNVTYDRRLRANRPLDVLFGTNKTENYCNTAPVKEPKYPKEMILQLTPGTGIVQYMGASELFAI